MQPSSWTDDNLVPHPEQAISILWRSETSSNIGGSFAPCSICHPRGLWRLPDLRNLVLTRLLHGRREAGDGRGLRKVHRILHASVHADR